MSSSWHNVPVGRPIQLDDGPQWIGIRLANEFNYRNQTTLGYGIDSRSTARILTDGEEAWLDGQFDTPWGGAHDAFIDAHAAVMFPETSDYHVRGRVITDLLTTRHPARARFALFVQNHFSTWMSKAGSTAKWEEHRTFRDAGLTRFQDLLLTSATSPAMMVYLDQQNSLGRQLNENYAREVMELHTVGVQAGYRQEDVTNLAHLLTGWGAQREAAMDGGRVEFQYRFSPYLNHADPVDVFGLSIPAAQSPETADDRIRMVIAADATCLIAPAPMATPKLKSTRKGRTLVALFLRGGIDGLNVLVPHGDKHYYEHRNHIAIPRPGGDANSCLDLDGFFGLHPAAASLMPLFKNGGAVALPAVGYAKNTRSHFEEQDTWETGVVGKTLSSDGWLNRHLGSSTGHGGIRAVAIGGNLPRMLRGRAPAYAIRGLGELAMPNLHGDPDVLRAALETAYCTKPDAGHAAMGELFSRTAAATLEGTRQLEAIAKQEYQPAHGAEYANTGIARQFRETARLIKAGIGTEVIQLDYGGWDTHNNQGGATGGFANRLRDLRHTVDFRDVLAETVSVHLGNPNTRHVIPDHDVKRVGML